MWRLFSLSLVLVACASDVRPGGDHDDDGTPDELSPTAVFLTPTQHLTRASLALRGMRPALADLRAVEADPATLRTIIDRYVDSPAFGETIMEMHNETLLMRIEQPQFTLPNLGALAGATARQMNGRFDEPIRLIQDIVMSDQPYTKIVTADYTMADATTATIWGLPHTGPAGTWERVKYSDGRPAVGILSTSAIFDRWRSTGTNYNRGRANLISRGLLCHDYLHADISVDTSIDLADPEVVANAVVANPSCAGCHQTLDPLASHLFGYKRQITPVGVDFYPQAIYTPATVNQWRGTNKRPPMYFGTETGSLAALGQVIADDPRFAKCAATRFASYFTEVELEDVSLAWVARLQAEFVASGFDAKELAKVIVLSDEFRVSHDTDADAAQHMVGALKLRPDQLHRMLRDLTGFAWSSPSTANLRGMPYGASNLLEGDYIGFRVLAGGIDGYFVTKPVHTMNATSSLVAKSAASAAADFVVDHDLAAAAAERTLFVEAAVTAAEPDRIRAQLAHLHGRIYGELVAPDSDEVDETLTLYEEALAETASRPRAWKLTLLAMLSDFRSLFY